MKFNKEDVPRKGARLIRMLPVSEPDHFVDSDATRRSTGTITKSSKSKDGWVSLNERLPKELDRVLFSARVMQIQMVGYLDSNGKITSNGRNYYVKEWASHWRPLPAPPKP